MMYKKYNKSIEILSVLIAMLLLNGCDMVLMNPKGLIGMEQKTLILTALGLMLIVVIPVIVMAFLFSWRYRCSDPRHVYNPEEAHSTRIEQVVWFVPIVIILILGTITWKSAHELDPYRPIDHLSSEKPITIEVVSLDWKWLFIYPELGIASINQLAFPVNVPVNFKVTSNSVMNSFFIPQLGSQIYAMAGMQTKVHLIASEAGEYDGISSGYSGAGFSGMKFTAIATSTQSDFEQWAERVRQSSGALNSINDFERLAQPSQNNQVEYFSSVKQGLFTDIIGKFSGGMAMHSGQYEH